MMMPRKADSNSALVQTIWCLYFILMSCTVILTRGVFKKAFPSESSYVFAGLAILGSWLLSLILFNRFRASKSVIGSVLVLGSTFLAIYWFFFAAILPAADINIESCATWDCVLMQELESGAMLDSWVIAPIGIILLLIFQFSLIPSFLFMLTRLLSGSSTNLSQQEPTNHPVSISSLLVMALLSIAIGGIEEYFPNYVAVSFIVLLCIVFSLLISVLITRLPPQSSEPPTQQTESVSYRMNLSSFLLNLFFLAGFIIFVFSFADIKGYPLERFGQFGLGILLFVLVYVGIISKYSQSYKDLIAWLNKSFFGVLLVVSIQVAHFYFSRSALVLDTGLSPVLSGFLLACFSIRIMIFAWQPESTETRGIPLQKIPSNLASLLILNVILGLVFVVSLFQIFPRDRDAFVTFLPGIAIGLIGLLLSAIKRS